MCRIVAFADICLVDLREGLAEYVQVVRVSVGDVVAVQPFTPPPAGFNIALLNAQISFTSKAGGKGAAPALAAVSLSKFPVNRFGGQVSACCWNTCLGSLPRGCISLCHISRIGDKLEHLSHYCMSRSVIGSSGNDLMTFGLK